MWYRSWGQVRVQSWEPDYHGKEGTPTRSRWSKDVTVIFHDSSPEDLKKVMYVRGCVEVGWSHPPVNDLDPASRD